MIPVPNLAVDALSFLLLDGGGLLLGDLRWWLPAGHGQLRHWICGRILPPFSFALIRRGRLWGLYLRW